MDYIQYISVCTKVIVRFTEYEKIDMHLGKAVKKSLHSGSTETVLIIGKERASSKQKNK